MSNIAKSKPEQLAQEVQKLRDLCYRNVDVVHKDKDDLSENNILISCDLCLKNILTDLEIKLPEKQNEENNILDKIQVKLLTFESNVLGTKSMQKEHSTIEYLIHQCTYIRTRMEANVTCQIL